ncbi:MAG: hypothetical protein AB7O97_22380 [Planctomycetota bacterium]
MIARLLASDWPWRRVVLVAVAAQVVVILCATRHVFFWGGALAPALHAAETLGMVVFAFAGGLAMLQAMRRAGRGDVDERALLRTGMALAALATLAPPFLSADLWDYLARGRVDVLGFNPYTTTVSSLAHDPAMEAFTVRARWTEWVMPYGPLAAALQFLCALPDSPWIGAYAWKACAALAHVATGVVVLHTLRLGLEPGEGDGAARRGMALWLWNPWLLLESCGQGHNDAMVALFLAAACHGVARARLGATAVTYGTAMLIKHGSPPLAPLLAIVAWRQGRLLPFAAGTTVVALIVLAAWLQYWNVDGGLAWITNQGNVARGSLISITNYWFGGTVRWGVFLLGLLTVAALMLLALGRVRDARGFGRIGALTMVVFVFACVPNFAVWYHLWWLPLMAVARAPAIDRVLVHLAFAGPLVYLVFTATHGYGVLHEHWGFALGGAMPALWMLGRWGELTARTGSSADPAPVSA